MSDPFVPRPLDFAHDIDACDCGCGQRLLILDADPIFRDEPEHLRTCLLPSNDTVARAMGRVVEEARNAQKGLPVAKDVALVSILLDGYLSALALLTRVATHGIDGTGDPDADDDELDRAITAAHDFVRATAMSDSHPDEVPTAVQIDLIDVATNLGYNSDEAADAPVPTIYEA